MVQVIQAVYEKGVFAASEGMSVDDPNLHP
jgi:predicted DNA-binding antitoxin AbrB/MazE fold protein